MDAQHNSSVANAESKKLRDQTTGVYGQIQQQATTDRNNAAGNLSGALGNVKNSLGSNPLLNYYQNGKTDNAALNAFSQAGGVNLGGNNPFANSNAYELTPAESQLLNSNVGRVQKQKESAISELRQIGLARGADPTAVAAQERLLGESYDQHTSDLTAQFQEQARQTRLQTLASIVSQGQGAYGQNLGGEFDLAGIYQNQQNTADSQRFNATNAIAGVGQQRQIDAQNYAAQGNGAFGNLLEIGGFALGGGFGGAGKKKSAPNSSIGNVDLSGYPKIA